MGPLRSSTAARTPATWERHGCRQAVLSSPMGRGTLPSMDSGLCPGSNADPSAGMRGRAGNRLGGASGSFRRMSPPPVRLQRCLMGTAACPRGCIPKGYIRRFLSGGILAQSGLRGRCVRGNRLHPGMRGTPTPHLHPTSQCARDPNTPPSPNHPSVRYRTCQGSVRGAPTGGAVSRWRRAPVGRSPL